MTSVAPTSRPGHQWTSVRSHQFLGCLRVRPGIRDDTGGCTEFVHCHNAPICLAGLTSAALLKGNNSVVHGGCPRGDQEIHSPDPNNDGGSAFQCWRMQQGGR
jgi:hypothetical protein